MVEYRPIDDIVKNLVVTRGQGADSSVYKQTLHSTSCLPNAFYPSTSAKHACFLPIYSSSGQTCCALLHSPACWFFSMLLSSAVLLQPEFSMFVPAGSIRIYYGFQPTQQPKYTVLHTTLFLSSLLLQMLPLLLRQIKPTNAMLHPQSSLRSQTPVLQARKPGPPS